MGTGGDAIHHQLDEAAILADIRYFADKVHELDGVQEGPALAMRRVYQGLLTHRHQILAAWRDGRPDRWYEYDHSA